MKKFTAISFTVCILLSALLIVSRIKIDLIPKAHSQTADPAAQLPPSASKVPAAPAPPVPQTALPKEGGYSGPNRKGGPDEELPPSAMPSPQDLDPSLKFVNAEGFTYDPTGRRDPFRSFISGKKDQLVITNPKANQIPSFMRTPEDKGAESLEGFELSEFKLVGIMWEVHDPKAMVLSPSKKVYMIHNHTRIGKNNGYVATIREGEVVVVEISPDGKTPSTRVMTLQN